jgi:hypothetical protein
VITKCQSPAQTYTKRTQGISTLRVVRKLQQASIRKNSCRRGRQKRTVQPEGENCLIQTTEKVKQSTYQFCFTGVLVLKNTTLKNILKHVTFFHETDATIHVYVTNEKHCLGECNIGGMSTALQGQPN